MRIDAARRRLLGIAFGSRLAATLRAGGLWAGRPLQGASTPRLIVLDWAFAETLLAMGFAPLGIPAVANYERWVLVPRVPAGVLDVGTPGQPNLELLQDLRPNLFVISPAQASIQPLLERIAPTLVLSIYDRDGQPYRKAEEAAIRLGQAIDRGLAAEDLLARAATEMATAALSLSSQRRPLYLIRILDQNHMHVYGANSMAQDVMDRVGVRNAWKGRTSYWGMSVIGVDQLAGDPDASLVYVEPLPAGAGRAFMDSPLWSNLPFVRASRVFALPPFWSFGGIPSATRFGRLLANCLRSQADTNG